MNNFLRERIDLGHILVTASNRQARSLRTAHATSMIEEGNSVWPTPLILPWKHWLKHCLKDKQRLNDLPLVQLLNSNQTRLLWTSIIKESSFIDSKLQINSIVDQAIHAYETCLEWKIDIFSEDIYPNTDAQAFRRWIKSYQSRMQQENWLDELGLADYLMSTSYRPDVPGVVVYGYDDFTPQQEAFFHFLEEQDCGVEIYSPRVKNISTRYFEFPDPRNEIRAVAAWAKNTLEMEPRSAIGIVIQDLEYQREYVSAIFDDILNPGWFLQDLDPQNKLYSIVPGRPLSDYPIIYAALQILSLGEHRHKIQKLEFLLRTSFIKGCDIESTIRAQFCAALRRTGEQSWRLKTLLGFINHHQDHMPVATGFLTMLIEAGKYLDQLPRSQTLKQWAESFNQCLKLFGWPGERTLNSNEYQTLLAWRDALLTLSDLGTVCGKLDYLQAFEQLKRILVDTSFQPESVETPVQVSGQPGVAGMGFDYIWITGLHDMNWPGPAYSNPFIPLKLQIKTGVPGCSADINMKRCELLTEKLILSTRSLIFSYAKTRDDLEYRPSNILKKFLSGVPDISIPDYKQIIYNSSQLEPFIDISAPEFSQDEIAGGGTGILTDQSACPFRAFARHRLIARGLDEIDIGLDPARRGLLVHAVLQGVWDRIGNSAKLLAMTDHNLDSIITSVVSSVIKRQAGHQPETYTPVFRELEIRRLVSLVKQWMEIEKMRPEFTVLELEKKSQVNFHGLNLNIRIDRIDELEESSQLIIDYKTGEVNVRKWHGDRPEEPQIPLYAVIHKDEANAVAFAGLKRGRLGFTGLSAKPGLVDGVKPVSEVDPENAWEKLITDWEMILSKLAGEFLQGLASVTPRKDACQYCDLHSLCRIYERNGMLSDSSHDGSSPEE